MKEKTLKDSKPYREQGKCVKIGYNKLIVDEEEFRWDEWKKVSYFREVINHQENNNNDERSKREGQKEIKMLVWNVTGLEEKK